MDIITVPQKVYDQMEELKDKQGFVSNVFDLISTIYCHDLHEWLYSSNQVNAEQSKWREKQFIKYFYGELEIKPEEPKLYNVYYKIGSSMHGDWDVYIGMQWFQGRTGITTADNEERFWKEKFTMSDIKGFELAAEVKFPESALHEIEDD